MSAATTLGRRRLPAAVPAAIALAWAAAVAAHATGLADHFHHHALLAHGTPGLAGVGGYALLWCVMVAAMMLPSAWPTTSTTMPCWPTAPPAWPASAGTRCCGA